MPAHGARGARTRLVPDAHEIHLQAPAVARAVQPRGVIPEVVRGPIVAAADPPRHRPGQAEGLDARVARLGLLQHEPLVPPRAVEVAPRPHVGLLGALGGLRVAADLDLDDLQRGARAGLEEVVPDQLLRGRRVVDQLPRHAAAAAQRTHALVGLARRAEVKLHCRAAAARARNGRGGGGRRREDAAHGHLESRRASVGQRLDAISAAAPKHRRKMTVQSVSASPKQSTMWPLVRGCAPQASLRKQQGG